MTEYPPEARLPLSSIQHFIFWRRQWALDLPRAPVAGERTHGQGQHHAPTVDDPYFTEKRKGGVQMDDETRKAVVTAWQERKRDQIIPPYLKECIPFGLVPHVQATLLARYLRGDFDAYPPFFWN